jgi:hypothetical protein
MQTAGFSETSYISASVHGVISQKTSTFTLTAVKTADFATSIFVVYLTALRVVQITRKTSNSRVTVDNELRRLELRLLRETTNRFQSG